MLLDPIRKGRGAACLGGRATLTAAEKQQPMRKQPSIPCVAGCVVANCVSWGNVAAFQDERLHLATEAYLHPQGAVT